VSTAPDHPDQPVTPGRFFDGDRLDPARPPEVLLERVLIDDRELFRLRRRLAYRDHQHAEPHVVPADLDHFASDLTSVPALFTWLVPRTGVHLPAALLHDALVADAGEPISYLGPAVDREEADRIFRDALGELGTSLLRRWLMWTAVTLASIQRGTIAPVIYFRSVMYASLVLILALGVVSTLDVIDLVEVLPWMGDRSWWFELGTGAFMAVAIPAMLSLGWIRLWRAGAIAGIALAFFLHVTLVLAVLTAVFALAEAVIEQTTNSGRRFRAGPSV
jgi:hypothetical protein